MARHALHLLATVALLGLTGCGSTTTPVPPCCYQGDVTTTRLGTLPVRTEDGRTLPFAEAYPGFTPQQGLFTTPLPLNEMQPQDVIYGSLVPLVPLYDANGDGRLEKPELLVLYAREAARATGIRLAHLGGDTPVWAVSAPNADVGGLVTWVEARRDTMTPEGQAIFRDLERLGQDLRTRGSEGRDDKADAIWIR